MADFSIQLRRLRKEKGLTQEALASLLGVRKTTISNYESGYSKPKIEMLERIAQALDVSIAAILNPDAPLKEGPDVPGTAAVPVYKEGRVENETAFIPRSLLGDGEFFLFEIPDSDMEPARLKKGDWVLCRRQSELENGALAAVAMRDETCCIRYVSESDGKYALLSFGKDSPLICPREEITILGKVTRTISSL